MKAFCGLILFFSLISSVQMNSSPSASALLLQGVQTAAAASKFTLIPIEAPKDIRGVAAGEGAAWILAKNELLKLQKDQFVPVAIEAGKWSGRSGGYGALGMAAMAAGASSIWIMGEAHNVNGIHRIDSATGKCIASIPLEKRKGNTSVTYAEGSLWVLNHFDGKLIRINPATNQVSATVELGEKYWQPLAAGDGGGFWVIGSENGVIKHIDSKSNKVVDTFSAGEQQKNGIIGLAFGKGGEYDLSVGEGTLWISNVHDFGNGTDVLFRMNPASHERVATIGVQSFWGAPVFWKGMVWIRTGGYNYRSRNGAPGYFVTALDPKTNKFVEDFVLRPINKGRLGQPPLVLADQDCLWIFSGSMLGRIQQVDSLEH